MSSTSEAPVLALAGARIRGDEWRARDFGPIVTALVDELDVWDSEAAVPGE